MLRFSFLMLLSIFSMETVDTTGIVTLPQEIATILGCLVGFVAATKVLQWRSMSPVVRIVPGEQMENKRGRLNAHFAGQ